MSLDRGPDREDRPHGWQHDVEPHSVQAVESRYSRRSEHPPWAKSAAEPARHAEHVRAVCGHLSELRREGSRTATGVHWRPAARSRPGLPGQFAQGGVGKADQRDACRTLAFLGAERERRCHSVRPFAGQHNRSRVRPCCPEALLPNRHPPLPAIRVPESERPFASRGAAPSGSGGARMQNPGTGEEIFFCFPWSLFRPGDALTL